jgi:hypothetical protein
MKFIVGISSLAIVSLVSIAGDSIAYQVIARSRSNQSLPNATTTIQLAGSIDASAQRAAAEERKQKALQRQQESRAAAEARALERKTRQQKWKEDADASRAARLKRQSEEKAAREERIAAMKKRQEEAQKEYEIAKQKATEQQRLDAERRQQYFESLSPQDQKVYLARQRAKKQEADAAAGLFLLKMFAIGAAMSDGNSGSSQSDDSTGWQQDRNRQNSQPTTQSSPAPDRAISDFYRQTPGVGK